MKNEFTAIVEDGGEGWYWAHSPEVPGANGQGRTPDEAREDLSAAIELVLDDARERNSLLPRNPGERANAPAP